LAKAAVYAFEQEKTCLRSCKQPALVLIEVVLLCGFPVAVCCWKSQYEPEVAASGFFYRKYETLLPSTDQERII
jgi:hypothetical protein